MNESKVELILGDCLEVMRDMPDKSVDAILTDLPYGTTACSWDEIISFESMWEQVNRINKGVFVTTASQPFTSKLIMSNLSKFKYTLVWDKKHGKAPGVAKYRPMPSHEDIVVFGESGTTYNPQMKYGEPYTDIRSSNKRKQNEHKFGYGKGFSIINSGTRYPLSVQEFPTYPKEGQHPTQKPVELYRWLIKTYTNKSYTVLDICMGSGTTGVACVQTGRNFIGIETNPDYFAIAEKRIKEAKMQPRLEFA